MKLLVFAHIPPPHHGQSYMVQLMLEGFGGDRRQQPASTESGPVECYHVNARFSDQLEDIGSFRWEKGWLVLRYCLEAIWCRFRYGVRTFYYVPAPGKRAALYRDWVVMLLCRPFFSRFVHHWHAVGLGDWLKRDGYWWERWLTHRLLGRPALGIALAIPSMRDALWFRSREVCIVPNGIPDPCPNFETEVLAARETRLSVRQAAAAGTSTGASTIFRVLYLAHCTAEKGLWDAIEGVRLLNGKLELGSPIRAHLTVAGEFPRDEEKAEFDLLVQSPEIAGMVTYAGFLSGAEKLRAIAGSDCLCFPTFYHAESLPVVVVEAMGAGLPLVTTRWRGIPELLPPGYGGFVPPHAPAAIAERLEAVLAPPAGNFSELRRRFLECFAIGRQLQNLGKVLSAVDELAARASVDPAAAGG